MTADTDGARLLTDEAGHVIYQRNAVSSGPFHEEPLDLWRLLDQASDASGAELRIAAAAWLLAALVAAGVDVRAFDRGAVRVLARDSGVPEIQVVAGWMATARQPQSGIVCSPDHRRSPAERLLDALVRAEVTLGPYDARLPRYLAEDCGPRSVQAITGWLGRVGRREVGR